ncbi:MAG: MBL fold metallo-hydrolase [Pseudanabaenaceae cyanobacterium bins.68]|nr:MBL fold metallo-hydrolase [Pseudanabaenaceae cyanobacterium bins.68]
MKVLVVQWHCLPLSVGHDNSAVCVAVALNQPQAWLLLDCGWVPPELLPEQPPQLAFCSHAHGEHSSGLAQLRDLYPDLPIYTSEVTARLLAPVYGEIFSPLPWCCPTEVAENLWLELSPAGHLPGAACLAVSWGQHSLVYTGDFCLANTRFADGLRVSDLRGRSPDVLVMEGSLGALQRPPRRSQENRLVLRILEAIATGQSVLLPVPELGTAQEILLVLRSHHQLTGKPLEILVDQAIAQVCDQYLGILADLPPAVQNFARHQPLFFDSKIYPRVRQLPPDYLVQSPVIMVVSQGTNWQDLAAQAGVLTLIVDHSTSPDFAYERYLFDLHSDLDGITQLAHNLKPQHLVLIHGQLEQLLELASLRQLCDRYQVHCPSGGQNLALPLGRAWHRSKPKPLEQFSYGGEILEQEDLISLVLPAAISQDPHWRNFAETGLLEAYWQGDRLILRGISQQEWLQG